MIDLIWVPETVAHHASHKGIVKVPWNHLEATLSILIQIIIVHVVTVVRVEVAHHRICRKGPQNPINVQLLPEIFWTQIQCCNEIYQGLPAFV